METTTETKTDPEAASRRLEFLLDVPLQVSV